MKSCNTFRRTGFTLLETMVATFIVLMAMGLALTGFMYGVRSQNFTDVQNDLDLDSQNAIEHLKRDLRLSTLGEILYNPSTAATYSAVSFPLAYDDDGDGSVEVNPTNSRIIWDETVIYHMWINDPNPSELRVTRFRPRSQTATQTQRQTQLNNVVIRGTGASDCLGSEKSTTVTLFENLFTWQIRPRAATFDGYATNFESAPMIDLGSYVLTTGPHTYKFRVVGKNAKSAGYHMGFDTFKMTPCSRAREAEFLTADTSPASSFRREEKGGNLAWSANQHLFFGAVATNASFQMVLSNDSWLETKFYGDDSVTTETAVNYKTNLTPRGFCVQLAGMDTNWTAAAQSSDTTGAPASSNAYVGAAVRVLLRGSDMVEGGMIETSAGKCVVGVKAGSSALTIDKMWIAECSSSETPSMDAKAGTMTQLKFAGGDARSIPAGTTSETDEWGGIAIDRTKSYLVTMMIKDAVAQGSPHVWNNATAMTSPGSYVISGDCDPDSTVAMADNWSALPTNYVVSVLSNIVGVAYMRGTYAPSGTYVSAVCNTGIPDPAYTTWSLSRFDAGVGSLEIRIRSGSTDTMSDAGDWSAAPVVSSAYSGMLTLLPAKPYVQFQLRMTAPADTLSTPMVRQVLINWTGQTRITDIGGQFTRGPSNGIWEVTIDGNQLKSGIQIDMELYRDVRGFRSAGQQRLTSFVSTEVMPRNTGK